MASSIMDIIEERLGDRLDEYRIPPPIFVAMHGEFLAFDQDGKLLITRFPVLERYLNPYGAMQGGMVAAAVDNTLGPLSMLVAPPNVTRRLEMKYSRPITTDLGFITVTGKLVNREGRWLTFSAEVRDQEGMLLARARATHWIVDETEVPSGGDDRGGSGCSRDRRGRATSTGQRRRAGRPGASPQADKARSRTCAADEPRAAGQ